MQYQKYGEFHEGYSTRRALTNQSNTTDRSIPSDADKLKQLQHEIDYLKQEMEFF